MPYSIKSTITRGCLGIVILAMTACSARRVPPKTVEDLMEDRVTLDGVLMKCNQSESRAHTDADCLNARIAIDRLASQNEAAEEAKRAAEFERTRERLRLSQDKQRQEEEAKTKVDAYHLPLVPVEPASPPPPPANDAAPPVARETNT